MTTFVVFNRYNPDIGEKLLRSQLFVLSDGDEPNPFISFSDKEEAAKEVNMVDVDDEEADIL